MMAMLRICCMYIVIYRGAHGGSGSLHLKYGKPGLTARRYLFIYPIIRLQKYEKSRKPRTAAPAAPTNDWFRGRLYRTARPPYI